MSELPGTYDPHAAASRWSAAWDADSLYRADPSAPGETFSIVIPPPNVTGNLHMGHALNNTLQDVLVRYKRMDGFNVLWVPGTDHAGIATQWVVRRQLEKEGLDFRAMGREAFVERVWAWKQVAGGSIANQLRRLGVSCDWSRERFTLDPELQRAVTEHFVKLYEDGLIYRGQRLINWDPHDQTALSDLEVEHDEGVDAELWSFAYLIGAEHGGGEIVVATTRPETMLGDTAVAVHPDDPRYTHLIGKTVRHPFVDRDIPIIGDAILVDPAFGTGAVKVTPAHDFNDFAVGQRHGLPMVNLLNPDGTLNANGGPFQGLSVDDARTAVKAKIEELGLFRGTQPHKMNLGRSQRSGAVVQPMLSTQWFVRMRPLATPAVAAVENGFTRFVPGQWANTYYAWLRDIQDWCISRQLWWGHRIPAWYCTCGEVVVARSAPAACPKCGSDRLDQDPDVLDTWFSSALWPFSVFGWPEKTADLARYYPTSVLVTGFDIIFFWVARMMFAGVHLTGAVPFRDVYIHALVRDKHGDKMSKTKGNVVDPLEVIDRLGADAFRFTLVAFAAQGRDVLWDEKRVEGYQRFTTKIWQALRYAFMNAEGYDPQAPVEPGPYERWIEARTGAAVAAVRQRLDEYKFNEAASEIYAFVWNEYCDWYIELSKAAIYDAEGSDASKNAVRRTLFATMGVIVRLLHPIMPFLTEEIWSRLPGTTGFVAVAPYPREDEFVVDRAVLAEVADLQETVTEIRRIRGEMEIAMKTPLELRVSDPAWYGLLRAHGRALWDLARCTVLLSTDEPRAAATGVVRGRKLVIPLEGVVDLSSEVTRLDKVLIKADKDVVELERRLANPSFVEKAPKELVDELRAKLAAAVLRRDTLRSSRDRLAAAL
ncbi:MAG: valine--tRNA ligase [Myxococcota bacterium]